MADLESVFVHKQPLCQHFLPTPVWTGVLVPSCFDFFHSQTLSFVHATLPEPPKTALFWKKNPPIHLFLSYLTPTELFPSAFFFRVILALSLIFLSRVFSLNLLWLSHITFHTIRGNESNKSSRTMGGNYVY